MTELILLELSYIYDYMYLIFGISGMSCIYIHVKNIQISCCCWMNYCAYMKYSPRSTYISKHKMFILKSVPIKLSVENIKRKLWQNYR